MGDNEYWFSRLCCEYRVIDQLDQWSYSTKRPYTSHYYTLPPPVYYSHFLSLDEYSEVCINIFIFKLKLLNLNQTLLY